MSRPQYTLYLSHSWLPEHVGLNIDLWDYLWEDTLLLVDDNQEEVPPFYVSRLEHLIRRSDMFMAVLVPPADTGGDGAAWSAGGHRVSPYVLFENSLARRAGLPRFVLYDSAIDFAPHAEDTAQNRHVAFDHRDPAALSGDVAKSIAQWLATVTAAGPPRQPPGETALVLLPAGPSREETSEAVRGALKAAGYSDVAEMAPDASDIEALDALHAADLLVADVGDPSVWATYGMAHATMVPTVRLVHGSAPVDEQRLPSVLLGNPVGYQDDLVAWSDLAELVDAVGNRARLIRQSMTEVDDLEEGRAFFARRR